MRLLVPIIVLQNHNRYNIMDKGHNYSINIEAIEAEVSCSLWFPMTYMLHSMVVFPEIIFIKNKINNFREIIRQLATVRLEIREELSLPLV